MFRYLLLFLLLYSLFNVKIASAEQLNVLLIAVDDLNTDLGCYGHSLVQSPNIDRLAQRGLRFEKAYSQYPVCNPSRSSFMTGLYPEQTKILSNAGHFRESHPELTTLPQQFMKHGYFAARVGKIYHYGVPDQIGTAGEDDPASWNETVNPRGLDREVHDRIHTLQPGKFGGTLSWLRLESQDEEQTDGIGALAAIDLLEKNHPEKTGKPFFLAVGFYRPHTPYVAPGKYFEMYPREKIQPILEKPGDRDDIPPAALADRPHQRELSLEKRKEIIQAYYASVSYMDAQVGKLLDAMDRLELSKKTVVVFISDHGYHLGHHGLWQKSDLFEGSCRVPMIIAPPEYAHAGEAHQHPVGLIDIYPTLTQLCELPSPKHVMGRDLRKCLESPGQAIRNSVYSVSMSRGGKHLKELRGKKFLGRTIRTDRYRYTEWGDNAEFSKQFYDYEVDPEEFKNLSGQSVAMEIEQQLRRNLHASRRNANSGFK